MAKTDWQMNDTVLPDDMNQIGQEINDAATAAANALDVASDAAAAAANAQNAINSHIGSGGNVHAAATTSQAGFMSAADKAKLDSIQAGAQVNTVTSVAGKTGAVTLTKDDVGLGSVQNYGVASQAQAQAGSANNVYMTPLRTKNYVDTRLLNNIKFRMNGGTLEYNDGTGWKPVVGFDPTSMTLNMMNGQSSVSLQPNTHVDIFSINGAGVLAELELVLNPTNSGESLSYTGVVLVVDGVEKPMYSGNGRTVWTPGFYFNSDSSRTPFSVVKTSLLVKFNTSLKVRVKNLYTGYSAEQSFTWALKGGYYS